MGKKLNWGIIIPACEVKHDGKYWYDIEEQPIYVGNQTKMVVHCYEHGGISFNCQ